MADNSNTTNSQTQDTDEHKKSLKRSWKSSGPVAKLTVVFAGIAALSTTIYALVAGGQLLVMKWQLEQMQGSGQQTAQVITLYHQQIEQLQSEATDTCSGSVGNGEGGPPLS